MTALGPLYLHHRDPRSLQVTSETSSVAARTFHTGTQHTGPKPSAQQSSFWYPLAVVGAFSSPRRRPSPSRATATCTSKWVSIPRITSLAAAGLSLVVMVTSILPLDVTLSIWPDDAENGHCCEGSAQSELL